jgi:hypothetical protein
LPQSKQTELAPKRLNYSFLINQSATFAADQRIQATAELLKITNNESERKKVLDQFRNFFLKGYEIIDKNYELEVVRELLKRISTFRDLSPVLGKLSIDNWVDKVLSKKEKLFDTAWTMGIARSKTSKLAAYKGPLNTLAKFLRNDMEATENEWLNLDNQIKALMPHYLDLKQSFKSSQFIPDANSTLRLTYGYIKRYSPNDAEIHTPFTTLTGVFEKANTSPDYRLPKVLADNLRVENVPPFFKDPITGEVVVCFLYNLDTTGGNSGSPVLDANGDLIGINFDRSYTATINDYAWNDKYSRSIGVDIRYVLYVMKYIGKADHLIAELGLDL